MKTKTKKLLSILLALMMMLSVVPFYASAATALTTRNVEIVAPSVSPAEITYGQPLSDVTITGGEMWYVDGAGAKTKVEGYFVHRNAEVVPAVSDAYEVMLKFVPTDSIYTCTATFRSGNTTYTGTWPTIKVKAESVATLAEAPIASSIIGGSLLSDSTLSGGKIVDENGNDITSSGTWKWDDNSQKVTENSTYKATWTAAKNAYNSVTADVNVAVAYNVITQPTLSSLSYKYFEDFSSDDLEIVPGVIKTADGLTDIPGTYKFEKTYKFAVGTSYKVNIMFIPDDSTLPTYKTSFAIEITKGDIKFVDENGAETVPVVTVPYGTKIDYQFVSAYLNGLKTNAESVNIDFSGAGGSGRLEGWNTLPAVGEHEFTVRLTSYNSNYAESFAKFKLVVEPRAVSVTSASYNANGKLIRIATDYRSAPGTYDVYVDGILAGSNLKYGSYGIDCPWQPEVSGTYNVKVVYNPAENDSCAMEDYETEIQVNVARNITIGDGLSVTMKINGDEYNRNAKYGDEIAISVPSVMLNVLAGWEIKDTAGNIVDLGLTEEQLKSQEITFTMPDYDIIVKAKSTLDEEEPGDDDNTDEPSGGLDDIFGDLTEGDSDNPIINFFNNIIAWFRNLIETIKNFFRGIGNVS